MCCMILGLMSRLHVVCATKLDTYENMMFGLNMSGLLLMVNNDLIHYVFTSFPLYIPIR